PAFGPPSPDWLKGLAQAGHPIGNHTYDHVNVTAKRPEEIQFRFNRAPCLIDGTQPVEGPREDVRLTTAALKARVGVAPAGFRTPGGFPDGLAERPEVQALCREQGFWWVSSKSPRPPLPEAGKRPTRAVLDGIVAAQAAAQPFVYP